MREARARIGRKELYKWATSVCGLNCTRIDDLKNGVIFISLFDRLFPSLIDERFPYSRKPDSRSELNQNWDTLHSIFKYLGIPDRICAENAIMSGNLTAAYNFLVLFFFLDTVLEDRQIEVDFAHAVDPVLAGFLQGQEALDAIDRAQNPPKRATSAKKAEGEDSTATVTVLPQTSAHTVDSVFFEQLRPISADATEDEARDSNAVDAMSDKDKDKGTESPADSESVRSDRTRKFQDVFDGPLSDQGQGLSPMVSPVPAPRPASVAESRGDWEAKGEAGKEAKTELQAEVEGINVARLLDRLEALQMDNTRLKRAASSSQSQLDKDRQITVLTRRVGSLRRQLDLAEHERSLVDEALRKRIDDLEHLSKIEVQAAEYKLHSKYTVDLAEVQRELGLAEERHMAEMSEHAIALESTPEESDESPAELVQKITALHTELDAMRRAYDRATARSKALEGRVGELANKAQDLDTSEGGVKPTDVCSKTDLLTGELNAAKETIRRLKLQVEGATTGTDREMELQAEITCLRGDLQRLVQANQYLRQRSSLFDKLNAEIDESGAALARMRARDASEPFDSIPTAMARWLPDLTQTFDGNADDSDARRSETRILLSNLDTATPLTEEEVGLLRGVFWEMIGTEQVHADRLIRCRHYIKALFEQLQSVREMHVASVAEMTEGHRMEVEEIRASLIAAKDTVVDDNASLQVQLHLTKTQLADLEAEHADMADELQTMRQSLVEDGDSRIQEMKGRVRGLREQLATQKVREDLWKSLVNTHREYIKLVKELPTVGRETTRHRELQARRSGLERTTASLIEQLGTLQVDETAIPPEVDDGHVKKQLETLDQARMKEHARFREAKLQSDAKERRVQELTTQLAVMKENEQTLALELGKLRQAHSELRTQLAQNSLDADARVARLRAEFGALADTIHEGSTAMASPALPKAGEAKGRHSKGSGDDEGSEVLAPLVPDSDSENNDGDDDDDDDDELLDADIGVLVDRVGAMARHQAPPVHSHSPSV
ncbi:Calponin [Carpediemonas membranifera]|uniref:Calponin n=1 Tax=Carpediemonas membranifera TaxID=201153 RepID=A0A8J6AWW6_9EUKA|nr:Calponin [Carpediemonas membranifera]|eukprot:KAG9390348.1 Calponin [Carpediemonas membranifera]